MQPLAAVAPVRKRLAITPAAAEGPEVEAQLRRSRALAHVFAIPGTPALAVGRTLVLGVPSAAQLERLLARAAAT
ncbi:thioredoxin domain-containing protein [Mangrovicoccus ximenensis]|uniref:hypothetical protein n=1 Tax=Mangrovicoccus ximenensis TaxID=1911570 RepID=UPI000D340D65|nr:hypothetical protein [Mangrovicoccus ximenensis]